MYRKIDRLNPSDLTDLVSGKIAVLHWPSFLSCEQCDEAVEKIESYNTTDLYEVTKKVSPIKKIGKAVFDYAGKDEMLTNYFRQIPSINKLLDNFFDDNPPLNSFLDIVNNAWPQGACVENYAENEMYYGLIREFPPGSFALAHQDVMAWDIPTYERAKLVQHQFAANVYLQTPLMGGNLTVIDFEYKDKKSYELAKLPDSYGIDVTQIVPAPPKITIKPCQGDLVMFNAKLLHEVSEVETDEVRITTSCFINYYDDESALRFFS